MEKRPLTLAAACFCLVLQACAGANLNRPKVPKILTSTRFLYTQKHFNDDYDAYKASLKKCASISPADECNAKLLRDSIVNRIRADIEINYREYASQLFYGRAKASVAGDILQLGLSSWATLAGAQGTQTVLAAILTGVTGTRLSIDKNFFGDRTTPLILARIDLIRSQVSEQIEAKLMLPPAQYPLEEAWVDLVELFYSGTLQAGIQDLSRETGLAASQRKVDRAARVTQRLSKAATK